MSNTNDPTLDEQHSTPSPPASGRRLKPAAITPHQLLGDAHKKSQAVTYVVLGVLLAGLLLCYMTVNAAMGEKRVAILDGAGNLTIAPTQVLSKAPGYFERVSLMATNVVFQRSVSGLILEDLLPVYFEPLAADAVRDDFKATKDFMEKRNLKMYPECRYISEPIQSGIRRIVTIEGVLTLTGSVRGSFILENPEFSLTLEFVENKDIAAKSGMPWKVDDVIIEVETDD